MHNANDPYLIHIVDTQIGNISAGLETLGRVLSDRNEGLEQQNLNQNSDLEDLMEC